MKIRTIDGVARNKIPWGATGFLQTTLFQIQHCRIYRDVGSGTFKVLWVSRGVRIGLRLQPPQLCMLWYVCATGTFSQKQKTCIFGSLVLE